MRGEYYAHYIQSKFLFKKTLKMLLSLIIFKIHIEIVYFINNKYEMSCLVSSVAALFSVHLR